MGEDPDYLAAEYATTSIWAHAAIFYRDRGGGALFDRNTLSHEDAMLCLEMLAKGRTVDDFRELRGAVDLVHLKMLHRHGAPAARVDPRGRGSRR